MRAFAGVLFCLALLTPCPAGMAAQEAVVPLQKSEKAALWIGGASTLAPLALAGVIPSTAGPALLSLPTGAPRLVCPSYTTDEGWIVRISEPLEIERTGQTRADVAALSRRMAAEFERAIAARPTDWHMFQPAWSS